MKLEKAASSPKTSIGEAWLPRGWLRSRVPGARARWECGAAGLFPAPQHTQASSAVPCTRDLLPCFNSCMTVSEPGSDARLSYRDSAAVR